MLVLQKKGIGISISTICFLNYELYDAGLDYPNKDNSYDLDKLLNALTRLNDELEKQNSSSIQYDLFSFREKLREKRKKPEHSYRIPIPHEHVEGLLENLKNLQQELQSEQENVTKLKEENEKLKNKQEDLIKVEAKQQKIIVDLEDEIKRLSSTETEFDNSEYQQLKDDNNELQKRVEELETENSKLLEKVAKIPGWQADLVDKDETIKNLKQQLSHFENTTKIASLEREKKVLEEKLNTTREKLSCSDRKYKVQEDKVQSIANIINEQASDADVVENYKKLFAEYIKSYVPRFIIPKQDKIITVDSLPVFVNGLLNTSALDEVVQLEPDGPYSKLMQRYKKDLTKKASQIDYDDYLIDNLEKLAKVVEDDLIKKIILGLYRGLKNEKGSALEEKLLPAVNKYLATNGFYTRDGLNVGNFYKDEDYEDMSIAEDHTDTIQNKGIIKEIILYPYCFDYIDEDEEKLTYHIEGSMLVVG